MNIQIHSFRKRWRTVVALVIALFSVFTANVAAQVGGLDPNFTTRVETLSEGARTTVVQADGKVIVGGLFEIVNGVPHANLARLNPDGSLDASFSPSTDNAVNVVVFDQNGKILIGGDFATVNGTTVRNIARLNPDGTLDATFNPGDGPADTESPFLTVGVNAIVPLSTGKYLVGGRFNEFNQVSRRGFLRLNADGSPDATYIPGGGLDDVRVIALLPDGGVIFAGSNLTPTRFIKLAADGAADLDFGEASPLNSSSSLAAINDLVVQPDGKITVGGFFFFTDNGLPFRGLARLNTDGTTDLTFLPEISLEGNVRRLIRLADGDFLVGGDFSTFSGVSRNNLARLNANGSLDVDFNPGVGTNFTVATLAVQGDSNIVAGGLFTTAGGETHINLARFGANGGIETSYTPDLGDASQTGVRTTVIQPDGKILIAGQFQKVNAQLRTGIARLKPDGALDPTFNPAASVDNGDATRLLLQPDGKILIVGFFDGINGTASRNVARFNTDGTADATFQPGLGPDDRVNVVGLQSDGKIIIGGLFNNVDSQSQAYLARLGTNGGYDASFVSFVNSEVTALAVQPDDRVVVASVFIGGNNRPAKEKDQKGKRAPDRFTFETGNVVRFGSDGEEDVTFTAAETNGRVSDLGLQSGGRVVLGGGFSTVNGTSANAIARLAPTGELDATFISGQGANGRVNALSIQPDQALLIGGAFTDFDGTTRNRVTRLTADGALDAGFDPGAGPDAEVFTIARQNDGGALVGGPFLNVSGQLRLGLARLGAVQGCSFTISSNAETVSAVGATRTVTITGNAGCPWEIVGTFPAWLSATPVSGTGSGSVEFTSAPNYSGATRFVNITIAGQPFSLTQTPAVLINNQVALVVTGQTIQPTACPGYAAEFVIDATLTNTGGQALAIPHFQVVELAEANGAPPALPFRLISADGATCGTGGVVGAVQSSNGAVVPTTIPTLAPGQSVPVRFRLALPSIRRFRFILNVLGEPGGPQ